MMTCCSRFAVWMGLTGLACAFVGASSAVGWIDYGTSVTREPPAFGGPFRGIALRLSTEDVEFEQDVAEEVTITLRNVSDEPTFMPESLDTAARDIRVYVVLADRGSRVYFSQNLWAACQKAEADVPLAADSERPLISVPFTELHVRRPSDMEGGIPLFEDAGNTSRAASQLPPGVYGVKAMILSGPADQRPDFTVASNSWPVLLLPKSGSRMSEEEKAGKLTRYMKRLKRGAYGGLAVSSQLAALGEIAVEPLLETAEKQGGGHVRESRIWALVTLCNTGSSRAEAYIRRRLNAPVDLGDLPFLAWHSQGFDSAGIRAQLEELALGVLAGERLPWAAGDKTVDEPTKTAFLEFTLKHFIRIRHRPAEDILRGCMQAEVQPKIAALALELVSRTPGRSPEDMAAILGPLLTRVEADSRLRDRAVSLCPETVQSAAPPEHQWLRAVKWVHDNGQLTTPEYTAFLSRLVDDSHLEDDGARRAAMRELEKHTGGTAPIER